MTRQEALQIAKPILFNTEMVKAILDGRKKVTRRCVKYKYSNTEMKMRTDKYGTCLIEIQKDIEGETFGVNKDGTSWKQLLPFIEKVPPFKKGDILYIRETWQYIDFAGEDNGYVYKASENGNLWETEAEGWTWHPSIHMPKEAARIFLKVTGVRVERLQDITEEQAKAEGICRLYDDMPKEKYATWARMMGISGTQEQASFKNYLWHGNFGTCGCGNKISDAWDYQYSGYDDAVGSFSSLWNTTVDLKDWGKYGWDANPYVWVIEFERLEVED